MNRTMKNKKGFTLMEMLIVVAIIAVLVAIAIPVYQGQVHKAKVGRNDPCPCGSGKKYKNCCLRKDEQ